MSDLDPNLVNYVNQMHQKIYWLAELYGAALKDAGAGNAGWTEAKRLIADSPAESGKRAFLDEVKIHVLS